jgi:DUF971 family protein
MSVWPTELVFRREARVLHVAFDDGVSADIPYETLRVESPSAEVQGHGPGEKRTVTGKQNVDIVEVNPVGRYAVRIVFDDGHDTGIYSWDYLRKLAAV